MVVGHLLVVKFRGAVHFDGSGYQFEWWIYPDLRFGTGMTRSNDPLRTWLENREYVGQRKVQDYTWFKPACVINWLNLVGSYGSTSVLDDCESLYQRYSINRFPTTLKKLLLWQTITMDNTVRFDEFLCVSVQRVVLLRVLFLKSGLYVVSVGEVVLLDLFRFYLSVASSENERTSLYVVFPLWRYLRNGLN